MWQRLLVRLLWWRYVKAVARAADRGKPAAFAAPAYREINPEPSLALVRIIGNDLIPRHRRGQSLNNLRFILENESQFPGCSKFFLLNRIVDQAMEDRLIELLERHSAPYERLALDPTEAAIQPWDVTGVPHGLLPFSHRFRRLWPVQAGEVLMRLYRHRNNAVINNNGARNVALALGKQAADWVMPWDGNCFLTDRGWQLVRDSVLTHPELPYRVVPLARVSDNATLLSGDYSPREFGEPQLVFRADARETFDPEFYYGRRPKVELLWRLGVPGPWDRWGIQPWDLPCPDHAPEAGGWCEAGWVARLASGRPDLERRVSRPVDRRRADVRGEAVLEFLDGLQVDHIERRWDQLESLSLLGHKAPDEKALMAAYQGILENRKTLAGPPSWPELTKLWSILFLTERLGSELAATDVKALLLDWFGAAASTTGKGDWRAPLPAGRAGQARIQALVGLYWALPALARLVRRGLSVPAGFDAWLLALQQRLLDSGWLARRLGDSEASAGFSRDLLAMSLSLHRRQASGVVAAHLAATCRLARLAGAGHWKGLSGDEQMDCLVLLSYLAEWSGCIGVSLWAYPSRDESWMKSWLSDALGAAERDPARDDKLSIVVASFRRFFGCLPQSGPHQFLPSEGPQPLLRPCADFSWADGDEILLSVTPSGRSRV